MGSLYKCEIAFVANYCLGCALECVQSDPLAAGDRLSGGPDILEPTDLLVNQFKTMQGYILCIYITPPHRKNYRDYNPKIWVVRRLPPFLQFAIFSFFSLALFISISPKVQVSPPDHIILHNIYPCHNINKTKYVVIFAFCR